MPPSKLCCASVRFSPETITGLLIQSFCPGVPSFFDHGQLNPRSAVQIAGGFSGLVDHLEFHLRGLADQFFEALRIARNRAPARRCDRRPGG